MDIRVSRGLLSIHPNPDGVFRVTNQGHVRLPAEIRHCCGIQTADRVLLVAYPERGLLVVYPPAVLDALITSCHVEVLDGDAG